MTLVGSTTRTTHKALPVLAAAVLLWLLFAQAIRGAVISSISFDEGPHLAVGYTTLRTGDLRLQPVHIHPPLANVLAAAPLLLDPTLPDPRTAPGWEIASLSGVTDTLIWQHRPPETIALAGRLPIILMAVLLSAFVYRWATDLGGPRAGLLALFVCVLDPNIIAHGQLITTDMAVTLFGLIAFYCVFRAQHVQRVQRALAGRQWLWLAAAGIALGAALGTKVTAALIAPLLALIVLVTSRDRLAQRIGRIAVLGLIAFVTLWAIYGFEVARVPGLPVPVPAATHLKIYQSLQQHYDEGHSAFLAGTNSSRGWWYYFPVAFLLKTPLPTLLLLGAALVLALRPRIDYRRLLCRESLFWTLGLFPIAHSATALFSSVDIGYRHLLPILPFLFIFIGSQFSHHVSLGLRRRRIPITHHASRFTPHVSRFTLHASRFTLPLSRFALYTLLAWTVLGAALIFPHDLAYFNELAGGPDWGYAWLVDSNLDWGQNLRELKTWLDAHGVERVYISQFSPSRPEAYGIQATMLPPSPRAVPFARFNPAPGWYTIGATTLQGSYMADPDTFAYFRTISPTARIGHALFIYHIPDQASGQWVAQCASPSVPLSNEDIQSGFGRSDLRLVRFDCTRSWWYPAGTGPGWYVDINTRRPDPRAQYPSAHRVYKPRQLDIGQFAGIYRVDDATWSSRQATVTAAPAEWLPGQVTEQGARMSAPISTTGPLQFEGFQLAAEAKSPGAEVYFSTAWRVTRGADAPLSIMAHLLDSEGRVVAVGDGLGVPIEVWQAGDVIVQLHWLRLPPELVPGKYWIETGLYRLDNMQRYQILQDDKPVGDRLLLAPIEVKQ